MIDSAFLIRFFRLASDRLEDARQHLCALDGEIGDGDHGTSMANGFAAIVSRLRETDAEAQSPGDVLNTAAQAFLAEVGATVGPLYASAMLAAGHRLAETPETRADLALLLNGFADGIAKRGGADVGDKTMIDAWRPAAHAADAAATGTASDAARAAAEAAQKGVEATATMIAARGRAARLKERSLGHVDPGAASAAILIGILAEIWERQN